MKFLSVKSAGIALFIGSAVVSTNALSNNDTTLKNTPSLEQSIVLKIDHDHDTESEDQHDENGHQHESEENKDNHATEEKSDDGHDHGSAIATKATTEAEHQEGISFSPEKMALANIKVTNLKPAIFAKSVYAPGEIKANGYTSYIVSPRTESVVISRHAILGEHVTKGQALVTLFSESMAEAQAQYRVAYSEWQRTKKLGLGTVSESRLLASETDYISAYGRLTAFGLTKAAIKDIVKNNSSNLGEYSLVAQRSGVVLSDDFSQGQRVPAGEKIMVLADEKDLWVEARVSPNKKLSLPIGTIAKVEFSGQVHVLSLIHI